MATKKRRRSHNRPRTGTRPSSTTATTRTVTPQPRPARRPAPAPTRRSGLAPVVGVATIVAVMIVIFLIRSGANPKGREQASQSAIEALERVPASALDATSPIAGWQPKALASNAPPVVLDGRPVVLFMGAEYCPYCAAERWPVVVALSRFGTFSGLKTTTSSTTDVFPDTPTVTFVGSTYTSDYVTFSSAETQDRTGATLQTPTPLQRRLFETYNTDAITGATGTIPFVMIGNRFVWAGASYDPQVLQGKTFDQIARSLADPRTDTARAIDGTANVITAAICRATDGQPGSVCDTPAVHKADPALPPS
jgi:thiol-disulfide isomerase/thioredoxin